MDQKDSLGRWIRTTALEDGLERQSWNMDQKDCIWRWIRTTVIEDGSEVQNNSLGKWFRKTVLKDYSTTVQNKDKNTLNHAGNYTLRETSIFPSFPKTCKLKIADFFLLIGWMFFLIEAKSYKDSVYREERAHVTDDTRTFIIESTLFLLQNFTSHLSWLTRTRIW